MKRIQEVNKYDIVKERKIAIYVRESSKPQVKDGFNIFVQEEKCRDYVKACFDDDDYENLTVYREKGFSATTICRPVLNKLIDDLKKGDIKCIIVQKLDRLARRDLGMTALIEMLMEYNVRLITLRENIDTDSTMWKFAVKIYTLLAEIEQDQISERTNEAFEYAIAQGSYVKGGKAPFGTVKEKIYKEDGGHVIVLKQHPVFWNVLLQIYDMSNNGYNCTQISNKVNSLDVMVENDKRLGEDQIERILRNKIYCGIQIYKGEEYKVNFDGCLDKKYWKQVQINRGIHLKRDTQHDYRYHGKIYCECGTQCVVDVSKKRLANGTYRYYKYYVCPVCGKRVSEVTLSEIIEPKLQRYYNEDVSGKFKDMQLSKIDNLDKIRDDLYYMRLNNQIDQKTYIKGMERCEKDRFRLTNVLRKKYKQYSKLNNDEKKEFIKDNIKRISMKENGKIGILYC